MQAMLLLIGFFLLVLGVMIGFLGRVSLISPANASLFETLSPNAKKKLCKKFCIVPFVNAFVLIIFSIAGSIYNFPRNVYLVALIFLLVLSLYDFTRTTTILNKLRTKTFNEKTDL